MSRLISLAPLTVLDLTPPEMVSCAATAGYNLVGLRLIPSTPEEPVHPIVGDTPLVRQTRKRADDLGIAVLDIETLRLRPDSDVARDYGAVLETGGLLGARHVLVAGMDPDQGRLADNLAALAGLAAEYELIVDLEFMPWTAVRNLTDAAEVLRAADRPNVGILIDSIHFDRSGSAAADIAGLPPSWFHYLQICDAPAERPTDTEGLLYQARRARELPGHGGIDLLAPLRQLPGDLTISVEVPRETSLPAAERAAQALAATRDVLARLT